MIIDPPVPEDLSSLKLKRVKVDEDFYTCGRNWLKKSNSGLWELYVEGDAFERGVINGKLTKELVIKQEEYFVNQINTFIPSKRYLSFLRYVVAWFNRNLDDYIKEEYKLEIYGISYSASDEFSYIGPKYQRFLNYHAAHDIGHALQDLNLVACTSFSAWNQKTDDSTLIIGRNFDMYLGDSFAMDKIICFINPKKGYKLMTIAWGGMIGAVSGMNEKGLTVTINAAKSKRPSKTKTPISLITREILQYAKNIEEAYAIAKKGETFVSESILIGSLEDNKAAIIEISPQKIDLFTTDGDYIVCANHYQGEVYKNDKLNIENLKESASLYRFKRVDELINRIGKLNIKNTAELLRDQKGLNDRDIGMGNEKAINQLIAHHSIIFKPSEKIVWVSTYPYQLGQYVAYDLDKIFKDFPDLKEKREIHEMELAIPIDSFLISKSFENFKKFKKYRKSIRNCIENDEPAELDDNFISNFINTNPEYYLVYSLSGDYFLKKEKFERAKKFYKLALSKEIPTLNESMRIKEELEKCNNN